MPPFTFAAFQAHIDAEFWQKLSQKKLDEAKLKDDAEPALAHYGGASSSDFSKSTCRIDLSSASFDTTQSETGGAYIARGSVLNTNTLEDFQRKDKNQYLEDAGKTLLEDIESGAAYAEPSLLVPFSLLCFADLKKYVYTYWMCCPAFPMPASYESKSVMLSDNEAQLHTAVDEWRIQIDSAQWGFFVYDSAAKRVQSLSQWSIIPEHSRIFCFADPSPNAIVLGWPARNLLYLLSRTHKSFDLVSYTRGRPSEIYRNCTFEHTEGPARARGWERTNAGALLPRSTNLASVLDPSKLADDAVNLNLKLMKWRIAPDLNLTNIRDARCLLLGAGTLGCYVARLLLAWGVSQITFVDSGKVSFSNPVRQPLFKFQDCLKQGRPKAEAAAEALKEIFPGVHARGINLGVPMIGHPYSTGDTTGEKDYAQLTEEFHSHDVIFLLMDSRESRWLPTLMGAAMGKVVINAALGFDNYVVLRHGVPQEKEGQTQLGCYFCNDVVVPADSTSDRSLDQQCTVTRPGLAALASATAVELLVSILQHPDGIRCPAANPGLDKSSQTVLGSVPHTVRGYLRTWENKVLSGEAYPQCSACGQAVVKQFQTQGWPFVERAINEKGYLEQISGLDDIQAGIEGIDVDWDESDSDEDIFTEQ